MDIWNKFSSIIIDLIKNKYSKEYKLKKWNYLYTLINNNDYIPPHFGSLLFLKEIKNKSNAIILDHGCGSCLTLCFLAIKKYNNIWGVEVNYDNDPYKIDYVNKVNSFLKLIFNDKKNRIIIYDGKKLPFEKDFFDFIFSQQVIEHVDPNLKLNYIKEESRVLKKNGLIYHQIPHRLVPYESHTRVWFLHWLPKKIFRLFFFKKRKIEFIDKSLFLDWPWKIKKIFLKCDLKCHDITHYRLIKKPSGKKLYGTSSFIRKLFYLLTKIPIIGGFFIKIFKNFFMLEVYFKKLNK